MSEIFNFLRKYSFNLLIILALIIIIIVLLFKENFKNIETDTVTDIVNNKVTDTVTDTITNKVTDPVTDPVTYNYIHNAQAISGIQDCKVMSLFFSKTNIDLIKRYIQNYNTKIECKMHDIFIIMMAFYLNLLPESYYLNLERIIQLIEEYSHKIINSKLLDHRKIPSSAFLSYENLNEEEIKKLLMKLNDKVIENYIQIQLSDLDMQNYYINTLEQDTGVHPLPEYVNQRNNKTLENKGLDNNLPFMKRIFRNI